MVAPGHELSRPQNPLRTAGPLTESQIAHFFTEGFVVVPNLVPPPLLARVLAARAFQTSREPLSETSFYAALDFGLHDTMPVFRELAVASPLAAAAAQLTPGDARHPRALCVVRDAFFRLQGARKGCNYHVDDAFFWPCEDQSDGPGVNIWVALDEVGDDGGGLAVAPRSFTEDWLDCREVIKPKTCEIHEIAPEKLKRLEAVTVVPRFKPGDAIVCTRYLFYRGNRFRSGSEDEKGPGIGRYSVRYMPGSAVFKPVDFQDGKMVKGLSSTIFDADPSRCPAVDLEASLR